MMNESYFKQQIALLISNFGKDEYTSTRLGIIWDHCKDLPDYNFGRIIKHFLETRSVKYPPLPTHFHEAAIEQRKLIEQNYPGTRRANLASGAYSETPIKEIMKKLGGETALEALENQIKKNQDGPR